MDEWKTAFVTSLFVFLGVAFPAYMTYLMARLKSRQDKDSQTLKETHALVNGSYGIQLELYRTSSRQLANLTKDPVHEEAARLAAKLADDHRAQEKKRANELKSNGGKRP